VLRHSSITSPSVSEPYTSGWRVPSMFRLGPFSTRIGPPARCGPAVSAMQATLPTPYSRPGYLSAARAYCERLESGTTSAVTPRQGETIGSVAAASEASRRLAVDHGRL